MIVMASIAHMAALATLTILANTPGVPMVTLWSQALLGFLWLRSFLRLRSFRSHACEPYGPYHIPTRANSGQHWPSSAQHLWTSIHIDLGTSCCAPSSGTLIFTLSWSVRDVAQTSFRFESRPVAYGGPNLAHSGRIWPNWGNFGPNLVDSGPTEPHFAEFRARFGRSGPVRPSSSECGGVPGRDCPMLSRQGQICQSSGPILADSAPARSNLAESQPILADSAPLANSGPT